LIVDRGLDWGVEYDGIDRVKTFRRDSELVTLSDVLEFSTENFLKAEGAMESKLPRVLAGRLKWMTVDVLRRCRFCGESNLKAAYFGLILALNHRNLKQKIVAIGWPQEQKYAVLSVWIQQFTICT
jgi:hypothetical protein